MRIAVAVPSAKTWWRNFVGDGAPMRLRLAGVDHDAHAVAVRRDDGAVRVTATLSS